MQTYEEFGMLLIQNLEKIEMLLLTPKLKLEFTFKNVLKKDLKEYVPSLFNYILYVSQVN